MEFFKQIFPLMDGLNKTTITIQKKGDKLSIGFLPEVKNGEVNDNLALTSVTGTPEDLDAQFFESVTKVTNAIKGVITNVEQVDKELKELESEKKKKERDKNKPDAKPEKKKVAPDDKKLTKNANKVAPDASGEEPAEKLEGLEF